MPNKGFTQSNTPKTYNVIKNEQRTRTEDIFSNKTFPQQTHAEAQHHS